MKLDEGLALESRTARNRILLQPMEGCDADEDGGIGELTRRRYLRFARSGAGIIWFEATAVCREGRGNPRQLFLTENNLSGFAGLVREIKKEALAANGYEPLVILQMNHAGRYSRPEGRPAPLVAYINPLYEKGLPCRVMTDGECDALAGHYKKTAELAVRAGFDGVDVKCCHGYLLNEFLSAFGRKGEYGGDFEGRARLCLACLDAVREVLPAGTLLTTRLSAYDGFAQPYGFGADAQGRPELTEVKRLLRLLSRRGVELVNITVGNPYLLPHLNRPARQGAEDGLIGVRRLTEITGGLQRAFPDLKLVLSGLSYLGTSALDYGEKCLSEGVCRLLGFGRMAFAYPEFYKDYRKNGRLDPDKICLTCNSCVKMMRAGTVVGCPVRDGEVYLPYFKEYAVGDAR